MNALMKTESQSIREHFGRLVEVTTVDFKGEHIFRGHLRRNNFVETVSIEIGLENGNGRRTCLFIGSTEGIKSIKDLNGRTIYSNPGLKYEKKIYLPWHREDDYGDINGMRIAKFGPDKTYTLYPCGINGFEGGGNVLSPIVLGSGFFEDTYSPYPQGRRMTQI